MTDKAERRKFLKAALAALATTAGATSCNRRTEPIMAMCYEIGFIEPDPADESVADPENPTPPDGEEQP